jgi:hypothetical protein
MMFHEMLYVKHQSCIHDCRILVHTPEFRAEERSFPQFSHPVAEVDLERDGRAAASLCAKSMELRFGTGSEDLQDFGGVAGRP